MAKAKKQFKAAVINTQRNKLAGLIPTTPNEATELLDMAQKRKAAGIGKSGRPPRRDKDNKKVRAAERGTLPGEMRKTVIINIQQYNDIDRIAYQERITIKQALADALAAYINTYKKAN